MAEKLVIYGNGQMAEYAHARFRRDARYEIVGFTVDRVVLREPVLRGLPIIPFDEIELRFPPDTTRMFVAVGPIQNNRIRADRYLEARRRGYGFVSYISPHAIIDHDTEIGENCSIGDNAVVAPYTRIGHDVRISAGAAIGHHCVLEDHCFIGVNCSVLGSVRIGARALVGAGAVIRDQVSIGEASIVGIGATIVRDVEPGSVHVAPEAIKLSIGSERIRT
jgi:sugar O-acyltransferase (sialic acid O-acetyltransferase NeuD family)